MVGHVSLLVYYCLLCINHSEHFDIKNIGYRERLIYVTFMYNIALFQICDPDRVWKAAPCFIYQ